jgi:DNA-binding CsgD family transcriptional regulator
LIFIDPRGAGKRSNRETCSDACRFAFYESRKEKAFQLWKTDGHTPEQIAALLSDVPDAASDSFTISRWIARRLRDAQKRTNKEIATALGTTESKVRALLARTKRNPRRQMERRRRKE